MDELYDDEYDDDEFYEEEDYYEDESYEEDDLYDPLFDDNPFGDEGMI